MFIGKIPSFAKINLLLKIISKFQDGYHQIFTIFQSIDLCDFIDFEITGYKNNITKIENLGYEIPLDDTNTVVKAIELIKETSGRKFSAYVRIYKKIPPASGLGGGSSNAAVILYALNKLLNLKLSKEELAKLGSQIGADVPYFLFGGTAIGTDKGNEIYPCQDIKIKNILLAIPNLKLSTMDIYQKYDALENKLPKETFPIKDYTLSEIIKIAENDLEKVVFRENILIKKIKEAMLENGAIMSLMSGSGSSIFGIFEEKELINKSLSALSSYEAIYYPTNSINRKEYWKRIDKAVK